MTVIWLMIDKIRPQEIYIKYQADMNAQVVQLNDKTTCRGQQICAFQRLNAINKYRS